MKNRFFVVLLLWSVCWGQICTAEEKSPLPLPDAGNVTLTLDEYNKLVELAAKLPKKTDVPPLPYSIKHANLKLHVENDGVLVTGADVLETFDRLEVIESTAEAIINAGAVGKLRPLSEAVTRELDAAFFG